MVKRLKLILFISASLITLAGLTFFIFVKSLEPNVPAPVSDVPIEYKIGWWAYQKALKVEAFNAEVIDQKLNLFNAKAVIQYSINGSLNYRKKWRPYIKSVFISERWVPQPKNIQGKLANIMLIPIVAVKNDENYNGEKLPFNINVQDYLHTGGWGKNTYNISVQEKELSIELHQKK